MGKRKYYHIEIKMSDGKWWSPIEGQHIIKSYWRGWAACEQTRYPSRDLRLIDVETGKIAEEVKGNLKVSPQCSDREIR